MLFIRCFLVVLLINSCSLFATREPELPDSGNQVVFIQPDRAEIVIQNFTNALNGLSIQNYLQCFDSNTFLFTPSQQSAATNPGIWAAWTYQEEQTYMTNLVSEAESFTGHKLTLSNSRYEIRSETEQQFIASYSLTIIHNRTSSGIPTTAVGDLILDLQAGGNGLWYISKWTDISTGDAFSWSEFKAVFSRN
ncbi:hypothetical protein EP331_07525 [bacterium]|nr:MAG: hypothetical protein EP331_07525 [bacterium]